MKKLLILFIAVVVLFVLIMAWTGKRERKEESLPDAGVQETLTARERYLEALSNKVTVNIDQSPGGQRLTVQYAVLAVCEPAGVPYQREHSAKLADPERKRFVPPVHVENVPAQQVISGILSPVGLKFGVDDNGLYLHK